MNIDLPDGSAQPRKELKPERQRLLIDLIFLVVALAAIPLAISFRSWNVFHQPEGVILLGILLGMTLLCSGLLSIVLRFASLSPQLASSLAARLGAQGGVLVAGVAGGIFVLISFLRYGEYLSGNAISVHPYILWLAVSLSLIPVVSFASLCATFFSTMLHSQSREELDSGQQSKFFQIRSSKLYTITLVLSAICFLSPALLPWIPKKTAPITEVTSPELPGTDHLSVEPRENNESSTAPLFSYSQPLNFDSSPPYYWEILTQKVLDGLDTNCPLSMSPEGDYLAYCSSDQAGTLVIFDLNRFAIHSTYPEMEDLLHLAWSPESDLLFCLTRQDRPFSSIIRVKERKHLPLPLLKEASFPNVQPFWWQDFEVAFFPQTGTKLYLDAASMRLRPIEESHRWRKESKKSPSGTVKTPHLELTESSRARFSIVPRITSYQAPGFQQDDWAFSWDSALSIVDKKHPYLRSISQWDAKPDDRFVSTARSMKTVRIRGSQAEVIYFTIKERAAPVLEASLPEGIEFAKGEEFRKSLESHAVCGFVCAPRINPLTGQVLGPDRERVRALVRWIGWDKGKASLWISEQYESIQEGDVVSDPHLWRGGKPVSISSPLPDRWWAAVSYPVSESGSPEPSVPDMAKLDRGSSARFAEDRGSLRFLELVYPVAAPVPAVKTKSPPRPAASPRPSDDSTASPQSAPTTPEGRIRAFVREHYRKLSARDFDGYVADYTEYIVYHRKAGNRDEYLRPAVTSLRSSKSIRAVPSESIEVRKDPSEKEPRYLVSYEVAITREDPSGKSTTLTSQVLLNVFLLGNTIRIVEESSPESDSSPN